ncbi:cystathionine gamma-synthase [Hesseltinella vesiculosa]|uniref:Cystathionine gamma-synthase n=1 Tax=Hesseltinella vesiculosa TaxID=101127 RepID=A0A1X2GL38_9FUNG|nr:cystathionine gamma-synthase [Hesseltinella vesiculosa]
MTNTTLGFTTKAVHSGFTPTKESNAVVQPITLAATFKSEDVDNKGPHFYSRWGNPNRDGLETALADLEEASHGVIFSSGMAAIASVFNTLETGSHIICNTGSYSGTYSILHDHLPTGNDIHTTLVDLSEPDKLSEHVQPNTKLVVIESPTNPTLQVLDIAAIAQQAHEHGALVMVDNTFMTPYYQQPLVLGADIVVHSMTKYLNGHSDVVMGAVLTNNKAVHEKLRFVQKILGAVPSPFDCYLARRSLATLGLRMEAHSRNALGIATFLEQHPKIERVLYPGLASHPQHDLAVRQQRGKNHGFSGVLCFRLKTEQDLEDMINRLELISLTTSLGSVHTYLQVPAKMTHANVDEQVRLAQGITSTTVRLAVGIEDLPDLIHELEQALA